MPTDRLGIDNSIAESHHLPRHRERWRLNDPFLEHVPYARPIKASYATIKWLVRRGFHQEPKGYVCRPVFRFLIDIRPFRRRGSVRS
jgi:hypothetical protein